MANYCRAGIKSLRGTIIVNATFSCCDTIFLSVKLKNFFLLIKPDHTSYLLKDNGSAPYNNPKKVTSSFEKKKINLDH